MMTNPAMKLDTLSYAKKLIEAGCAPKLAEAHASMQQDVLVEISEDYLSQFVTKQEMNARFDLVDARFDAVDARFDTFAQKMENLVLKMTIGLGSLVVAGVIVLAAIIKL